jgi:hypothetical protein
MKFALHYLNTPSRPDASPSAFSYDASDYANLRQAVEHAKHVALTELVGVKAIKVDDHTGETQVVLSRVGGKWIDGLHF